MESSAAPTVSYEGCTLVLPAFPKAGTGNLVSPMVIDLLIFNMIPEAERTPVEVLYSKHMYPIIGGSAFAVPDDKGNVQNGPTPLMTGLEVYKKDKLVLLQQRGCIVEGGRKSFVKAIGEWAVQRKIARVVLIGTLNSSFRNDQDIECTLFRHLSCDSGEWTSYEETLQQWSTSIPTLDSAGPLFPTASCTRLYLEEGFSEIPSLALLTFSESGVDELSLATSFAGQVYRSLFSDDEESDAPSTWRLPYSWGCILKEQSGQCGMDVL